MDGLPSGEYHPLLACGEVLVQANSIFRLPLFEERTCPTFPLLISA